MEIEFYLEARKKTIGIEEQRSLPLPLSLYIYSCQFNIESTNRVRFDNQMCHSDVTYVLAMTVKAWFCSSMPKSYAHFIQQDGRDYNLDLCFSSDDSLSLKIELRKRRLEKHK